MFGKNKKTIYSKEELIEIACNANKKQFKRYQRKIAAKLVQAAQNDSNYAQFNIYSTFICFGRIFCLKYHDGLEQALKEFCRLNTGFHMVKRGDDCFYSTYIILKWDGDLEVKG